MNIFALDEHPENAAVCQYDKHVVKMVLETAQILSTVHHLHDSDHAQYVYRPTHTKHPCTLWAASNTANYHWLVQHFFALAREYQFRFDKVHKSYADLSMYLHHKPDMMDIEADTTPFALAMPDQYKFYDDPVDSYRAYYLNDKIHLFNYTRRPEPDWIYDPRYATSVPS